MDLAGVSMALGAFLAGVLLASSEYRRALETDIEPFRGLLMGLFFVAVGMSIDFALLAERASLVLALVAGFSLVKLAALFASSWPIGVARGQRLAFAAVLSQGSEFAFVVFGVAGAAQVLPGDWNKLQTGRVGGSGLETIDVPREFWKTPGAPRELGSGDPLVTFRYDQTWEFVDAIRSNRPCKPDFYDGARVQGVIDAALRSAETRQWVTL